MVDFPYTPTNKVHAAFKAQFLATVGDAGDGDGDGDIEKLRAELSAREEEIRVLKAQIEAGNPEIGKLLEELAARDEQIRGLTVTIEELKAKLEAGGGEVLVEELPASIIAFYTKAFGPHGGLSTKSPEAGWLRRVIGEGTKIHDLADWALDKGSLEERTKAFVWHMNEARSTQSPAQEMTDDELGRLFEVAPEVSKEFEDAGDGEDNGDDRA